ncbi:MAG: hypothetical protein Q9227_000904 [Pyrenula ochraceoflavens]
MPAGSVAPQVFDTIEDSIAAFSRGEFIVVLDSEARENEGDLIIAAEDMTPEKMAFMVRHTSGFVCAPMPSALSEFLDLPLMVNASRSTDPNRTAYTISVDAADSSVTTGISAHDRSLTCRMLASAKVTPASFRRPGHILPLRARSGGVLERRGHTEAAVEFCRLSNKRRDVGVICELVEEGEEVHRDGCPIPEIRNAGMMRRDACLRFGRKWGLRVCTIEDLVKYVEGTETSSHRPYANGFKD